ncbi:MAG: peptide-methionine (S)-S-oxide reductase MsrA [Alcanivoracaceae bacterium]
MATFPDPITDLPQSGPQSLVLGGGCFWCTEAVYLALDGVTAVTPGYAGGSASSANYDAVCSGTSGHAEVIRIDYDADHISLGQLLKVFFSVAHDPTQLNRQGNDRGSQYRSAVFCRDAAEVGIVRGYIDQLNKAGVFDSAIVTTLEPLETFYPAEDYHRNYAARNPLQPYILFAASPKVSKLKQAYPDKLKRS